MATIDEVLEKIQATCDTQYVDETEIMLAKGNISNLTSDLIDQVVEYVYKTRMAILNLNDECQKTGNCSEKNEMLNNEANIKKEAIFKTIDESLIQLNSLSTCENSHINSIIDSEIKFLENIRLNLSKI